MLKIGDRVEYWYRMGRVGTVIGIKSSPRATWMVGGTPANAVDIVVRFDDGLEESYQAGDLRLAE